MTGEGPSSYWEQEERDAAPQLEALPQAAVSKPGEAPRGSSLEPEADKPQESEDDLILESEDDDMSEADWHIQRDIEASMSGNPATVSLLNEMMGRSTAPPSASHQVFS